MFFTSSLTKNSVDKFIAISEEKKKAEEAEKQRLMKQKKKMDKKISAELARAEAQEAEIDRYGSQYDTVKMSQYNTKKQKLTKHYKKLRDERLPMLYQALEDEEYSNEAERKEIEQEIKELEANPPKEDEPVFVPMSAAPIPLSEQKSVSERIKEIKSEYDVPETKKKETVTKVKTKTKTKTKILPLSSKVISSEELGDTIYNGTMIMIGGAMLLLLVVVI